MSTDPASTDAKPALEDAVRAVLEPLARLAVANGLPYAVLEQALKQAVVEAAGAAHPQLAPHRRVSRIATATGINRREVTRLVQQVASPPQRSRSLAGEVFAHWQGTTAYQDETGGPRVLPRQGPAPSFEALAQAVTRDVHPRSLLAELLRLKLAAVDEDADTVSLVREGFVPGADRQHMLQLLGDNVGDHLNAAVANVLGDGRSHFEQAVYADGLSESSMKQLRTLIGAQWKLLLGAFVPPLERMVEADAQTAAARRVRIGLYAYDEALPDRPADTPAAPPDAPSSDPRPSPRRRRTTP